MTTQRFDSNVRRVIGENVRRLRQSSGKGVPDLAASIGMARGYWYEVETAVANVTIDTLDLIAGALGVPVLKLLTEPPATVLAQSAKDKRPKRKKAS